MAVIDNVLLLDIFWLKELVGTLVTGGGRMQGQFAFSCIFQTQRVTQPLELRIRRIARTRVQSTADESPNSLYFANTCAKCSRLSFEFVVFLEHVCKVLPFEP